MCVRWNWLYIRIAGLKLKRRGWKVIVPIVKEGEFGDYHSVAWMWFYIIIGRELHQLEAELEDRKQAEYKRSA